MYNTVAVVVEPPHGRQWTARGLTFTFTLTIPRPRDDGVLISCQESASELTLNT